MDATRETAIIDDHDLVRDEISSAIDNLTTLPHLTFDNNKSKK